MVDTSDLHAFMEEKYLQFNATTFIDEDPISVVHQFSNKQDIEIIGLWIATIAWGNRKSIINSGNKIVELMDGSPYDFILNHKPKDRQRFKDFKHRTFQYDDSLYFLDFFQHYYMNHHSLESLFATSIQNEDSIEKGLIHFRSTFFQRNEHLKRTEKHVASPLRGSTCKRLCMFLRWMVRRDNNGVDFGLWHDIHPRQLMIPMDVHVERVAKKLGILHRKQRDWKAVKELTHYLRQLDYNDPVKYDYTLFGLGVIEKNDW